MSERIRMVHDSGHAHAREQHSGARRSRPTAPARPRIPVCGMRVDPHKTAHRAKHAGRPYYFCSAGCRTKFLADPDRYLGRRQPGRPVPEGAIYTCPMHPEVRQVGPGSCPICGMALEPVLATAETGPNPELADMTRRFWIGAGADNPGRRAGDGRPPLRPRSSDRRETRRTGSSFSSRRRSCSGPAGRSSCAAGNRSSTRNLNMFTLIAMGTGVAWIYSVVATLVPGHLPAGLPRHGRRGRGLFRGGGGHHGAGAARPGAGAPRPRDDERRHPRAARPCAEDRAPHRRRRRARKRSRSTRCGSATACASGPARACRSTALSSRAGARSTNRWSPANPCR